VHHIDLLFYIIWLYKDLSQILCLCRVYSWHYYKI